MSSVFSEVQKATPLELFVLHGEWLADPHEKKVNLLGGGEY